MGGMIHVPSLARHVVRGVAIPALRARTICAYVFAQVRVSTRKSATKTGIRETRTTARSKDVRNTSLNAIGSKTHACGFFEKRGWCLFISINSLPSEGVRDSRLLKAGTRSLNVYRGNCAELGTLRLSVAMI